jgi:hypothetical protein
MSGTRAYADLGGQVSAGEVYVRTGLVGAVGVVLCAGNPNGVLVSGARGQLAVDVVGGVVYQSTDGAIAWVTLASVIGGGGSDPIYSTGADGVLTFDGVTPVAGLVPAAGVYTMARDLLPSQLTVQAGVRLKLAGSAIFGSEWAQIDGVVDDDGLPGGTGTAGAARAARRFDSGAAGGDASGANAGGTSGEAWPALAQAAIALAGGVGIIGPTATARMQGGAGGGSAGGFPGDGGAIGLTGGEGRLDFVTICSGYPRAGFGTRASFGSGGGSGGSGPGVGSRGGGGAGGGCALVAVPELRGTGRISARGGNGGAPTAGDGYGGAGGGGGGLVIAVYDVIASTLALDVAGGAGGAGDGTTGRAGGGGAPGFLWQRPLK